MAMATDDDEPDEFHSLLEQAGKDAMKSLGINFRSESETLENLLIETHVADFYDVSAAITEIDSHALLRKDAVLWKKTIIQGLTELHKGEYDDAQRLLAESYNGAGVPSLGIALAFAYDYGSLFGKALAVYDELLENDPLNPNFVWCKADSLERAGQRSDAITLLRKSLDNITDSALLWRYHAELLTCDGAYKEALTSAKKGAAVDGTSRSLCLQARIYRLLAHDAIDSKQRQGKSTKYFKSALDCYDSILAFEDDPKSRLSRGLVLIQLKRYKEARNNFRTPMLSHYSLYGMGRLSEARGDIKRAQSFYTRSTVADDRCFLAWRGLARIHARKGELQFAAQALLLGARDEKEEKLYRAVGYIYRVAPK